MKAYLKNLSEYRVLMPDDKLCKVAGFGEYLKSYNAVYIDENLSLEEQRLTLVHEVLEIHFPRVKHSRIDKCAIDILDCMLQLEFL